MNTNRLFTMSMLILPLMALSCHGQRGNTTAQPNTNKVVGGQFENGDWLYKGQPQQLAAVDTSAGWPQQGQKILITGVVYQAGARKPAPGVVVYYYHTDTGGRYVHKPEIKRSMPPNEHGQTHGYIRGWVKTDAAGRYAIYTVKPGAYPDWSDPAHIHLTIKEPNDINEYYIDDIVFDDDPLVSASYRAKMENRAGSGLVKLEQKGDLMAGERDIYLGLNIPDYPDK